MLAKQPEMMAFSITWILALILLHDFPVKCNIRGVNTSKQVRGEMTQQLGIPQISMSQKIYYHGSDFCLTSV